MGGPAYQAGLLSGRRMDPDRYETLLVHGAVAPGEQSMADFAEREGARMRYLPTLGQPVNSLADAQALRALTAIAREFRPHVVHTHAAKAGFLARLAALPLRPRPAIVHTYHGHVLEGYFGPVKAGVYRTLERLLARRSDCLIGVSEATVADLVRLGVAPRDRFRVIPVGLDLDPFANLDPRPGGPLRDELNVAEDEALVTYVGRIVPIKRPDVLLRAIHAARTAGGRLRLAMVGDGEERPALERLAHRLGIEGAVDFLGYRRDLPAIAAAADCYAVSSDNEGTPVSLIEGGAAARPAVATSVGGVPEVVTPETGILVGRRDHDAFANALARLAADRDLRLKLGERARKHVLHSYSATRLVADIAGLYEELLERKPLGSKEPRSS
jgi:glycosyltransferase involved in cell wall biosynthesis